MDRAELGGQVVVEPLTDAAGPSEWVCRPHPDKAISQRATLLAGLADGESRIHGLADCRDTGANLRALRQLGIPWHREDECVVVRGVDARSLAYRAVDLDAGNSATTARLLVAVLAGTRSQCTVTGNASLRGRPMDWLVDSLRELGAELRYLAEPGRLPVAVRGRNLRGGTVTVRVDSAQAVSALLFASIHAADEVVLERRTPARDHTERLLRWAGVPVEEAGNRLRVTPTRPAAFELTVPGDPSGAAVLAALHLAAGVPKPLRLTGVCLNQRRLGFFHIARRMGVPVSYDRYPGPGPEPVGDITIGPAGRPGGVTVDGGELVQSAIDELPLIAALATRADGVTTVRDAADMREKDTDRIAGLLELLHAFGAEAHPSPDGFTVLPSPLRAPRMLRLPADHRLVFTAFVLAALAGGRTEFTGAAAAATSYPAFLTDAASYLSVQRR